MSRLLHLSAPSRSLRSASRLTCSARFAAPSYTSPLFRSTPLPSRYSLQRSLRKFSTEPSPAPPPSPTNPEARENIYTLPNALTLTRIAACPVIGYYVLQGELGKATALLFLAGVTDLADGYIARKYDMGTVLGSILDPAADKLLMTTMVVTLAMKGMLPLPLAGLILGRDVLLSLSAFYFRFASLPPPKTFTRYWDFSIPSAEVKPTDISKYNTALQLLLVGATTVAPLMAVDLAIPMLTLQWAVAGTTLASGLSYVFSKNAVKYIK